MSSLVHFLSACGFVWMLWTTFCRAQFLCIHQQDCRSWVPDCLQGVCILQNYSHCPKLIEQHEGEEVLVSHLRPVTISPPEGTCGRDRDNSAIDINFRSSNPTTIYRNYKNFENIDDLDDPGQNFGSGQPPSVEQLPINDEDFIFQVCGAEETICPERHPRDQKLLIHLADRQVIGDTQCMRRGNSGSTGATQLHGANATDPLCALQIGEGVSGFTCESTFAFKILMRSVS